MLRNADELMLPAVASAIAALPSVTAADAAVIKLAERYAAVIDDAGDPKLRAWAMRNIGPLLLDALEALGATPRARARPKEGRPEGGTNRLAALRAAHTTAS